MGFESWLERDHVMLLDFDAAVVGIASQPFRLFWCDRGEQGGVGCSGFLCPLRGRLGGDLNLPEVEGRPPAQPK